VLAGPSASPLFIQFVKHTATVDVGECGTKAAAVTAVGVGTALSTGVPLGPTIIFNADHPFLFLIRERSTGSILFMSQVMNPNLK
jgi:serpin B